MQEEIIFKVSTDTGNATSEIDKLEKELEKSTKTSKDFQNQLKVIKEKVDAGNLSMREISKSIRDYESVAINAGKESPIGQFAIKKAGELKSSIENLRKEIDITANSGKNLQEAMQIGSGLVAGYGAIQGATALLGSENENLQKTFVKLQAVQSVLMGIEQIRATLEVESSAMMLIRATRTKILTVLESIYATAVGTTTGAMKLLRLAMLSLPIIAIIAAITALIMWIVSLAESGEDLVASNESLVKSFEAVDAAMSRSQNASKKAHERRIEMAKAQGKSIEEIRDLEISSLRALEDSRKFNLDTEKYRLNQLRTNRNEALKAGNVEAKDAIDKELAIHKDKYQTLVDLGGDYRHQSAMAEQNYNNTLNDTAEKQAEKQATQQKQAERKQAERNEQAQQKQAERNEQARLTELERQKLYQDLVVANIADENTRAIAELSKNQQRELDITKEKFGEKSAVVIELQKNQSTEMLALIDAQDLAFNTKQDEQIKTEKDKQKAKNESIRNEEIAFIEGKLIALEENFYAEQELKAQLAQLELEDALAKEDLTEGEKFKIRETYNAKIRDLNQETSDHSKELKEKEVTDAINWSQQGLTAISSLTDAFFSNKLSKLKKGSAEEERVARNSFKVNKALMLVMAGLDSAKAITTSLAMSPVALGPVPNPAGIASLAFAAASSIASIAKIASTQFTGGGGGSGGSSPSVSTPSVTIPEPATSLLPDNTTQTAGLNQGGTTVKIVDSDIKTSLNKLDKVNVINSFG